MTPNEVKQKRKVSAAAADRAGASWGSVTSRALRHGPAPSTAAASALRRVDRRPGPADDPRHDGDVEEDVRGEDRPDPSLVARPGAARGTPSRRRRSAARTAREPAPRTSERPRKRKCPRAHASGSPAASVSTVDAAACHIVNQSSSAVPAGSAVPPPAVRPRSRIASQREAKKSARKADRDERRPRHARRASAQDGVRPLVDPAVAVATDHRRRELERLSPGRRRSGGTRQGEASRRGRAARTCCRAPPPGSARRA